MAKNGKEIRFASCVVCILGKWEGKWEVGSILCPNPDLCKGQGHDDVGGFWEIKPLLPTHHHQQQPTTSTDDDN